MTVMAAAHSKDLQHMIYGVIHLFMLFTFGLTWNAMGFHSTIDGHNPHIHIHIYVYVCPTQNTITTGIWRLDNLSLEHGEQDWMNDGSVQCGGPKCNSNLTTFTSKALLAIVMGSSL